MARRSSAASSACSSSSLASRRVVASIASSSSMRRFSSATACYKLAHYILSLRKLDSHLVDTPAKMQEQLLKVMDNASVQIPPPTPRAAAATAGGAGPRGIVVRFQSMSCCGAHRFVP